MGANHANPLDAVGNGVGGAPGCRPRRLFAPGDHAGYDRDMADMSRHRDFGLFLLRIGIGGMFMTHGVPKLIGGPATWERLGGAMRHLGIDFAPTFWGFMAAFAEAGGGLCLALGVAFRPACALMFATMFVAATKHLVEGDGLGKASHAIEAAIVFLSLLLIGPGSWKLAFVRSGDKSPRKDR